MTLMEIALVLTCIETQKVQKFCLKDGEEISEKKSTARFIDNVFIWKN